MFLYLETRGRKSGQPRQIEIWFVEYAGRFYLCAEMRAKAQWVQNLLVYPEVVFSVGTRDDQEAQLPRRAGRARVLDAARDAALVADVSRAFEAKHDWSDGLLVEIEPAA